jgi:curli biogenesis system outer membrane secretion channel CsgG
MKRIAAMLFLLSMIVYGCATSSGPTMVSERQTGVALKSGKQKVVERLTCTQQSNIRVAVGNVTCKAAACRQTGTNTKSGLFQLLQLAGVPSFEGIGDGLQDMFTSALQQTGCFRILSKEAIKSMKEFGIEVKQQKPDYIVVASVTSIIVKRIISHNKELFLSGIFSPMLLQS